MPGSRDHQFDRHRMQRVAGSHAVLLSLRHEREDHPRRSKLVPTCDEPAPVWCPSPVGGRISCSSFPLTLSRLEHARANLLSATLQTPKLSRSSFPTWQHAGTPVLVRPDRPVFKPSVAQPERSANLALAARRRVLDDVAVWRSNAHSHTRGGPYNRRHLRLLLNSDHPDFCCV